MFKQGQEVRDAADPNRIGIVVRTGSSLGDRVLWCFDESLTWTSERPVVAPRTKDQVTTDPMVGDYVEFYDGRMVEVIAVDQICVTTKTIETMSRLGWIELLDEEEADFRPVPA